MRTFRNRAVTEGTSPGVPNMPDRGLFDYGQKFQTEARPEIAALRPRVLPQSTLTGIWANE
jgi:hypothetical protein